ncbi:MAG: 30S ribosomal protein S16 [Coriobacteriia bacterium]|nr:30S ribosomal protein S16 [Coriobacteriia bacterium]
MAVKIRLARTGAKKTPFYRIVAADSRAPRDGRFIEVLGRYNPRANPSFIELDVEKTEAWVAKGAQMSDTVARLLEIAKNPDMKAPEGKVKVSKKSSARAKKEEAAAEAPAKEAPAAEAEAPAAEAEAPAEEAPAEEAPAEEAPAEEAPAEEAPAEEAPAEEAPAEEADDAAEEEE